MKNVHVVTHTHWDREWYFSVRDSYVLLTESFKRVVNHLEKNKNDSYVLDAQSSILEDFINFVPSYKVRVEKLINSGQLIVGPWYTQTDCLYVSPESIIQNLKVGSKISDNLGSKSRIAYLPDTFGFNEQMPTILSSCGIKNAIVRRGVDYNLHDVNKDFIWSSHSTESIIATHLYKGYGEMGHLTVEKEDKLVNYLDAIDANSSIDNILCLCGGDQTEIFSDTDKNITELNKKISKYNLINSNLDKYISEIDVSKLKTFTGDLRIGSYDRVHRSIGSVRYDIKQKNTNTENRIYKRTNPMIAIAYQFGIDIEQGLIEYAMKKLFENQAHDSLGACVTDEVYEDIMYRFKEIEEILDGIENMISYRLSEIINLNDDEFVLFNLSAKNRNPKEIIEIISQYEYIDIDCKFTIINKTKVNDNSEQGHHFVYKVFIDEYLPSLGFKTFKIRKEELECTINSKLNKIETNSISLEVANKSLVAKLNGETISNFISFYDCGNDGDTYDFSPVINDSVTIYSKIEDWSISKYDDIQKITLTYILDIPTDLKQRSEQQEKLENIVIVKILVFSDNTLKVEVEVNNVSKSHRLQMAINSGIKTSEHYKSVPYTSILDNDHELDIADFEKKGYVEQNLDLKVLDNVIAKSNEKYSIAIQSFGSKEYSIDNEKMLITLFATTSEFGKGNLLSRPGRASGDTERPGHKKIATPLAEYIGKQTFNFTIKIDNEISKESISDFIVENTSGVYAYQKQVIDKFRYRLDNKLFDVPVDELSIKEFSLLSSDLPLENIEKSKNGYIIRVSNPSEQDVTISEDYFTDFKIINQVNSLGEPTISQCLKAGKCSCTSFYIEKESSKNEKV